MAESEALAELRRQMTEAQSQPSSTAVGEKLKKALTDLVMAKRRAFAAEAGGAAAGAAGAAGAAAGGDEQAEKLLAQLELLATTLSRLAPAAFTTVYCQTILQRYPSLSAASLAKAQSQPQRARRQRHTRVDRCDECGGPVVDGSCTVCHRANRGSGSAAANASACASSTSVGSDMAEKMAQFESDIAILLAISPLPQPLCEKADEIVVAIQRRIPSFVATHSRSPASSQAAQQQPADPAMLRSVFAEVGMKQHYMWCTAMWYYITGWRPTAFSRGDMDLLRQYYRRALLSFFKRMNQLKPDGSRMMSNLWSVQAIVKLIICSSSRLTATHLDLYLSLHSQNPATEQIHCGIWDEMARTEGWTFE